jgi:hypothetical protein
MKENNCIPVFIPYSHLVQKDLQTEHIETIFSQLDYLEIKLHKYNANLFHRFYHLVCIQFLMEEFFLGNCSVDILMDTKPSFYDIYCYKKPMIGKHNLDAQHEDTVEESENFYKINQFYLSKHIIQRPNHLYMYYDHRNKKLYGRRDYVYSFYFHVFLDETKIEPIDEIFEPCMQKANLKFIK